MSLTISFAEVRALVTCLKRYEGGYIEKNYYGPEGVSLKLRKSGIDSTYLHFVKGSYIFLNNENSIGGKKGIIPIENSSIRSIRQIGTDRIIAIEGPKTVIIEMMGGGNLVVLQDGIIQYSTRQIRRKRERLRTGESYTFPEFIDLESDDFDFAGRILKSSGDPIRTLATRLGLSKYAEEILCAIKSVPSDNSELLPRIEDIKVAIHNLLKDSEEGNLFIYGDNFYVRKSSCRPEEPEKVNLIEGLLSEYEKSKVTGGNKNEAILRNVSQMNEEAEKYRRFGEIIMERLESINQFINNARQGEHREDTNFDRGEVSFRTDDSEIPLKLGISAGENANNYFKMSKKIRDRLSRVKLEPVREEKRKPTKETRRIFTNYRWFLTSDGNIAIAGKDATSNDSVVKKYLDEKDLYFHADIHGAPSIVMKTAFSPTEKGIEEVAAFAWCMSKAWNAGFGNGSVYYVTKSQVSKTPESGEYLARGAWIIRGKKNYISHLNLEIAIGFQTYEKREYVVSGPPSAISGRKVIVVPGEDKEDVVKEISSFLGVEKDVIYPVLPPGGSQIREKIDS